jgi:hypothetical protein
VSTFIDNHSRYCRYSVAKAKGARRFPVFAGMTIHSENLYSGRGSEGDAAGIGFTGRGRALLKGKARSCLYSFFDKIAFRHCPRQSVRHA